MNSSTPFSWTNKFFKKAGNVKATYLCIMRHCFTLILTLAALNVAGQNPDTIIFLEPIEIDSSNAEAEPIGGYDQLVKLLEQKIAGADTTGRKYLIGIWPVRFRVSEKGVVDSTSLINHVACGIHRVVAKELLKTRWSPATEHGKPVAYWRELHSRIRVTKKVLKKYGCRAWHG